jgi:hypothetical protein
MEKTRASLRAEDDRVWGVTGEELAQRSQARERAERAEERRQVAREDRAEARRKGEV